MKLSIELAIVFSGALIAFAILLTDHWQISAVGYGVGGAAGGYANESVYRMDRWTGRIEHCVLAADPGSPKTPHNDAVGSQVQCPAPQTVPYNATPQ